MTSDLRTALFSLALATASKAALEAKKAAADAELDAQIAVQAAAITAAQADIESEGGGHSTTYLLLVGVVNYSVAYAADTWTATEA